MIKALMFICLVLLIGVSKWAGALTVADLRTRCGSLKDIAAEMHYSKQKSTYFQLGLSGKSLATRYKREISTEACIMKKAYEVTQKDPRAFCNNNEKKSRPADCTTRALESTINSTSELMLAEVLIVGQSRAEAKTPYEREIEAYLTWDRVTRLMGAVNTKTFWLAQVVPKNDNEKQTLALLKQKDISELKGEISKLVLLTEKRLDQMQNNRQLALSTPMQKWQRQMQSILHKRLSQLKLKKWSFPN